MLISPLMGPIIGIGLAVGIADLNLFRKAIINYLITTFLSVVTATIYFSLSPITEAQSELLARTSPTLYDVLIALCGGAAGILAVATKGKKQRDTGCCDCYCPNATTLYGGLRTCNGQHILLLGCLLSLLHQYCFHRFHHLRGRSFNALPS